MAEPKPQNAEIGTPEDVGKAFAKVSVERVPAKLVKVKGTLKLSCPTPNGVKRIQEAINSARKAEKVKAAEVKFYVVEAPKYSVVAAAKNRKLAEEVLQTVGQAVISNISKQGGTGSFKRAK